MGIPHGGLKSARIEVRVMRILLRLVAVVSLLVPVQVWAAGGKIYIADKEVEPGATSVSIPVLLDTDSEWHGYEIALQYDATKISFTKATVAGTVCAIADTEGWAFGSIDATKGRLNFGVVMDLGEDGTIDQKISPGNAQTILILTANILGAAGTTTQLSFRDDLWVDPENPGAWVNILSWKGEAPTHPSPIPSITTITIKTAPPSTTYRRCDSDGNGKLELTDAVRTLTFLFLDPTKVPPCRAAGDCDNNGKMELTDAVRLLTFLFLDPSKKPDGFPNCSEFTGCDYAGVFTCPSI
jgi:hypothetical protein